MSRTYSFDPVDLVRNWVGPDVSDDAIAEALDRTHGTEEHRAQLVALDLLLAIEPQAAPDEREAVARKVRALRDELGVEPVALIGDPHRPIVVDEYVG
jgi:hypothetical protein